MNGWVDVLTRLLNILPCLCFGVVLMLMLIPYELNPIGRRTTFHCNEIQLTTPCFYNLKKKRRMHSVSIYVYSYTRNDCVKPQCNSFSSTQSNWKSIQLQESFNLQYQALNHLHLHPNITYQPHHPHSIISLPLLPPHHLTCTRQP